MLPARSRRPSRRQFVGALGAVAGGAAVSGCSSEPEKDMDTLHVWGGIPAESGPQRLIDRFHEKHPDLTVEYTRYINDDRGNLKLNTALQGGVDIDVFFTYGVPNLTMRVSSGLAADVGDQVRSTPELAMFLDTDDPKALIDGDEITALATTRIPQMVLFNESLRERAGIDLPRQWTFEEYLEVIRALAADGKYGSYVIPDLARIELGPNYRFTPEGDSNFSHPAFQRHLDLSAELIRDGVLYPWSQALARQLEAYQQNNFIAEDFGLWTTAPYSLRFLTDQEEYPHDFTVSAAPVPTTENGDWNTGEYGAFVQINSRSPKQELAWEFSKFWLLEGAQDLISAGYISLLGDVDDEQLLAGILGEDAEQFFDVDSFRRTLFEDEPRMHLDTELTAYTEITQKFEQQRDVCWLLERSPTKAIETVDRNAQALIERFEED
ncbi:ABC transporter substrate-binding protein [Brachybacterium sacelli]|uniref:Multiple sugar transport system substrate-binding protein n=1 Tax=Brachybacterium sacelli TaxID=173364 RepID=A0ABS4WXS5_9MICO|nr:extracellular solute-binding protein [Brachybacterium sacelli]MBP2381014.1 multiple sugar transport system substrate-binding protein [Brachybacterium sacelli]